MRYWRGYLVAAILAAITIGLGQLAERYTALVDMFYPYLSRTMQSFLAEWSGGIAINLWQLLLVLAVVILLATIVLMILLKWNFVQWLGWVLSACALVWFLNMGVYGMNRYAGPLAEDLRLDLVEFTVEDLEEATIYFRDKANELALEMPRDDRSELDIADFDTLAQQAGDGFQTLVYQKYYSVYAGAVTPVKELNWADMYSSMGVTAIFVPITGEISINPQIPQVSLPFTMCREMARRMSIADTDEASFSAFLACIANEDPQFQYSGYFMAYRYCIDALEMSGTEQGAAAAARIKTEVNAYLQYDLRAYEKFYDNNLDAKRVDFAESLSNRLSILTQETGHYSDGQESTLLANWYIQEFVMPYLEQEDITGFDPMDENQVDIHDPRK